jgi:hypothetical protein
MEQWGGGLEMLVVAYLIKSETEQNNLNYFKTG